jgi:hypothetical protein
MAVDYPAGISFCDTNGELDFFLGWLAYDGVNPLCQIRRGAAGKAYVKDSGKKGVFHFRFHIARIYYHKRSPKSSGRTTCFGVREKKRQVRKLAS